MTNVVLGTNILSFLEASSVTKAGYATIRNPILSLVVLPLSRRLLQGFHQHVGGNSVQAK